MGDIIDMPRGNKAGASKGATGKAYLKDLQERHAKVLALVKTLYTVMDNNQLATPSIGPHSTTSMLKTMRHVMKDVGTPVTGDQN